MSLLTESFDLSTDHFATNCKNVANFFKDEHDEWVKIVNDPSVEKFVAKMLSNLNPLQALRDELTASIDARIISLQEGQPTFGSSVNTWSLESLNRGQRPVTIPAFSVETFLQTAEERRLLRVWVLNRKAASKSRISKKIAYLEECKAALESL